MQSILICCPDVDYDVRIQDGRVLYGYIVSKDGSKTYCSGFEMTQILHALIIGMNKWGENAEIVSTLNYLIQ